MTKYVDIPKEASGGTPGSGDVVGPASSVNNEIVLFSGTTGKLIKRATGTGVVKATSGVYSTGSISLTSEVTGVLPIANGGTNSSTALNNNRIIISSAGSLTEAAAITANRALASNVSGIPTASTTTDTELGFLSGVTSSVQTQLNTLTTTVNTKVTKVASTDNAVVRFDGTTGDIQNSGVLIADDDSVTIPSSLSVTGSASFILFPSLTTTERNALIPAAGMVIYNSTVNTYQGYVAGSINDWVDMLGWGAPTG